MRRLVIAFSVVGLLATSSAFAADTSTCSLLLPPLRPRHQIPGCHPGSEAIAPKTRAQVYQELIQSEKSGQLDYLNRTLYWHG